MAANPVRETIRESWSCGDTVYVFPSQIAAALWLEAALGFLGAGTVPADRFVAWDRFKEEALRENVGPLKPVSSIVRKLYALDLARRNGKSEKPFLSEVIPTAYAEDGERFSPWISRMLPSLSPWRGSAREPGRGDANSRAADNAGTRTDDGEDRDLGLIADDYEAFLSRHRLFEPAWQKPPIPDRGRRYVIFFPDAIEDFSEYAEILDNTPFVRSLRASDLASGAAVEPALTVYGTSREEYRAVALQIESLLREGTPGESIAVSVPDLDTAAPYLARELSLRGIPHWYRSGAPLSAHPAGRLFALVENCVGAGFPFRALKALLLDRAIPWARTDLAEELIGFGIRNHCVTPWKEGSTEIDVWEAAFRTPGKSEKADWRLRDFYRTLKDRLVALTSAKRFSDVRKAYFSFRDTFLDISLLPPEDDAVLARCVAELGKLEAVELEYPEVSPERPWSVFLETLGETTYVAQGRAGGVSVFPFRVAAGTPFERHFVLDASQERASVTYRPLSFLRQDKRERAGVSDIDASGAFFSAYAAAGADFSFSERGLKGFGVPHGWFASTVRAIPAEGDPYVLERGLLSGGAARPDRAYRPQKDGYDRYAERPWPPSRSYLSTPYGNSPASLVERVRGIQTNDGAIRVSQSDLRDFGTCNASWFLSRALGIEPMTRDAELPNERNLGLLYHAVLRDLYARIRDEDRVFVAARRPHYVEWASAAARKAPRAHAEFRGPRAAPLIETLARRVTEGIAGILARDADHLDGFAPQYLEQDLSFTEGGIRYYGKIDRISVNPADGTAVIIDYKSGKARGPSSYALDAASPSDDDTGSAAGVVAGAEDGDDGTEIGALADYQIPMYVYLAENSPQSPCRGKRVGEAWFASIKERKFQPIVTDNDAIPFPRRKNLRNREEFADAMAALAAQAASFAEAVSSNDWRRPEGLRRSVCASCDFRSVCRYLYAAGGRS